MALSIPRTVVSSILMSRAKSMMQSQICICNCTCRARCGSGDSFCLLTGFPLDLSKFMLVSGVPQGTQWWITSFLAPGCLWLLVVDAFKASISRLLRLLSEVNTVRYDNTGGPRGQLACHPAAAQFVLDNAANSEREGGLNAVKEIVSEVPGLRLVNGYLKIEEWHARLLKTHRM